MYDKIDDFLKNFEVHNQEFIAGKTPVPVSGKVIDNLEKTDDRVLFRWLAYNGKIQ